MSTPSIRIVGFLIVVSMLLVPAGAQAAPETQLTEEPAGAPADAPAPEAAPQDGPQAAPEAEPKPEAEGDDDLDLGPDDFPDTGK